MANEPRRRAKVLGRRGRRPRADKAAKKFVGFWVTEYEFRRLAQWATLNRQNVGPMCRDIALDEAESLAERGTPDDQLR